MVLVKLGKVFRVVALLVAGAALAHADTTTYNYVGNDFTFVNPFDAASPLYTSDSITGSFTTTSLADNLAGANIGSSVTAYSFSDGVNTWTPSNSSIQFLQVSTNAQGVIDDWAINLASNPSQPNEYLYTCNGDNASNGPCNFAGYNSDTACYGSCGYNDNSPGAWTVGGVSGSGTEEYYAFTWGEGGTFDASLSLLPNLENESYEFTTGTLNAGQCTAEAEEQIDAQDGYAASINSPNLPAGTYCIGFNPSTGNIDPNFTLTFNTPVEGLTPLIPAAPTPEPNSFVLLSLGLVVIGVRLLARRRRAKSTLISPQF